MIARMRSPLALGCQHITREALRAGLAAGIELVDTAHAYGNEAMVGQVVAEARAGFIVTKGGLGMDWVPDGRAKTLADHARQSRELLGRIELYLLHAVDPRTSIETSVRALAKLRDDGIVGAIGISNVHRAQLDAALAVTALDAIEVELGLYDLDALHLAELCERRGMRLLAYRPFGGAAGVKKLAKDPLLKELSGLGTPCELGLAFLRALSPAIVPLPGATRIDTAESCARRVDLPSDALAALRLRFLGDPSSAPARAGEVVMIAGIPGAGKSTLAEQFAGYRRLNRDECGGTLKQLAAELELVLARGDTRVVLDNTYASRSSRAQIVRIAKRHGLAVRCLVLDTPLHEAQRNAAARIIARYGRLLQPEELVREKQVPPSAQFRFQRQLEPPLPDEGFSVERIAFERAAEPDGKRAAIVELDGVIWKGRPRDRIELLPGARDVLARYRDAGYALAATTWQPEPFDPAIDAALHAALGFAFPIARCTHPPGPPVCWCRKPLPGLALLLAHDHGFALAPSLHVGRGPADRGFALRAGLTFVEAEPIAVGA
jgi:aryl-alcohol dehydrogenase-like predicted oxidoreductase/predicted kinase